MDKAYTAYFRFNNERTLSTHLPSELQIQQGSHFTTYLDPTRRYDNQVVIYGAEAENHFDDVFAQYRADTPPEICIEPVAVSVALSECLIKKGFIPSFSHEFLALAAGDYQLPVADKNNVRIEMWGTEKADDFLALLKTSGLVCADEIWQAKRHLYCTEDFRCYVALIGETPCGWATTFFTGQTAILANAYTQESFRTQGCQTALLHRRIQDAIAQGATLLLTDVMPDSISSKNCKRLGFSTQTIRTVWEKVTP
ncbi:GNAT family N-acetyltransferase [Photobacterium galatheae]|uniref:Acetyltransferase n=1 Tax=Photobacterium galatheae TaxID=1654360 RepID=A0A066RQW6_9GAMM|nr:GNAT family N-acetyltransferase [Photobacterium galatheae]KDM92840.1 acetyltransferase [Photobacterium galatheae]MCM0148195.1 GNAT family N-acetyltransferase [Photobacterium galatheae]